MSLALASMLVASGVASAQEMADTTKVNVLSVRFPRPT